MFLILRLPVRCRDCSFRTHAPLGCERPRSAFSKIGTGVAAGDPAADPCLECNDGEMIGQPQYASALELRFILDVMEERSHLGLDNQTARKLRELLLRELRMQKTGFIVT